MGATPGGIPRERRILLRAGRSIEEPSHVAA